MVDVTLRSSLSRPLTHAEADSNFTNLKNAIAERLADYVALRAYTSDSPSVYITDDGIAGFFRYDSTDTTSSDNGGTIIVASNGKRWKRVFDGSLSVNWFGASASVANNSTAINAAFAAAAVLGQATVEFSSAASYPCTVGLTLDINKVGVKGNGAFLNFSSQTTINALTFTQSEADANLRTAKNNVNAIERLYFIGPGANDTSAIAVVLNDAVAPTTLAGGVFRDCTFLNWGIDVAHQNGAFCWNFEHCAFTVTVGTPTTYSVTFARLTNNGERNTFTNCFWYNRKLVLDQSNGNADTYLINCSVDGGGRMFTVTGGSVKLIGGHIEHIDDADYWGYVSGENTLLSLNGVGLVTQANIATYSPFYSDSTSTNGGIVIKDTELGFGAYTMTQPLVAGTGRVVVSNITSQKNGTKPTQVSDASNALAYGDFESANYTAEWTLANGAIRSSAQARTGTYSLSFPSSVGVTASGDVTISVKPGQYVYGELWYLVPAITGTSGSFYVEIR